MLARGTYSPVSGQKLWSSSLKPCWVHVMQTQLYTMADTCVSLSGVWMSPSPWSDFTQFILYLCSISFPLVRKSWELARNILQSSTIINYIVHRSRITLSDGGPSFRKLRCSVARCVFVNINSLKIIAIIRLVFWLPVIHFKLRPSHLPIFRIVRPVLTRSSFEFTPPTCYSPVWRTIHVEMQQHHGKF